MINRISGLVLLLGLLGCFAGTGGRVTKHKVVKPNIIFIMADDLGYGDLGCYGQEVMQTPHIDALAQNGLLFTNFYAGSPVCAPSRSVLMTGLHTGHTTVRGNFGKGGVPGLGGGDGRVPLEAEDKTMAEFLKEAGYYTAMIGKWGLGEPNTTGLPNDQGFDYWFGHLNQRRAHSYFPDYLWENKERYDIPENVDGQKEVYSHQLMTDKTLQVLESAGRKKDPFFLYLPYLLPHDAYEVPEVHAAYATKDDWTEEEKIFATMVTNLDNTTGSIVHKLKELKILENTLIVFTSDNGAAQRWEGRFNSSGPLRGRKRDVYEGGIRVPTIISWPAQIDGGRISGFRGMFADFLPTFCRLSGVEIPDNLDGNDFSDVLFNPGRMAQEDTRTLYWEFHEQGGKQALLAGGWKLVRLDVHEKGFHSDLELFNLVSDPGEQQNVAPQFPYLVDSLAKIMDAAHVPSAAFPFGSEE